MEFSIDYKSINQLKPDVNGIVVLRPDQISLGYSQQYPKLPKAIDQLGNLSAKAQGLKAVITNWSKFATSDHTLYLKIEGNKLIGFLKVGYKKLFFWDELSKIHELNPLCVLDFYVNEEYQRNGFGKVLFEKMLEIENISPEKIAYDRPSDKLIKFLRKHYNLKDYIAQNNNYVIFNEYFLNKTTNKNNKNNNQIFNQDNIFKNNFNNNNNNNKNTNSNWQIDNNEYESKSPAKPRTLGATSSMANLNTKNDATFAKLNNTKIKSDYSPIRTGNRNFSKLIPTNSTSKNEELDKSNNKSGYNDDITPTKQRNAYIYENKIDFKNQIFYENLYPQSHKVEKQIDNKETFGFFNDNNNDNFSYNKSTSKLNKPLNNNLQQYANLNDKENKNFNMLNNPVKEDCSDNYSKARNNPNTINQNQNNFGKGIFSSKKNFSSFTLAHENDQNMNNFNETYTEIKAKNNSKNEFTSSSANYGAYYKVRK